MCSDSREQANKRSPHYVDFFRMDANPSVRPSFMHFGHWSIPDERPLAYGVYKAQEALAKLLIELAAIRDGTTILDAGCGFGGMCQLIDRSFSYVHVVGADLDAIQLDVCADLGARPGNTFSWICCDATSVPLDDNTVDAVISVESAMHFNSRRSFFGEASRILRPGGRVAMVDVLLDREAAEQHGRSVSHLQSMLEPVFYPLPEFGIGRDEVIHDALDHGLRCTLVSDISGNTYPTFLADAYDEYPAGMMQMARTSSTECFVELHTLGILKDYFFVFSNDQAS